MDVCVCEFVYLGSKVNKCYCTLVLLHVTKGYTNAYEKHLFTFTDNDIQRPLLYTLLTTPIKSHSGIQVRKVIQIFHIAFVLNRAEFQM